MKFAVRKAQASQSNVKRVRRILSTIPLLLLVCGCGSHGGVRPARGHERAAIITGAKRELQPFLRSRGLHPGVGRIAVSRRDPQFAYVEIKPLNAAGQQVSETADIVLVQAAGEWIALLDGTDLSSVCAHPAPRAVPDLVCH